MEPFRYTSPELQPVPGIRQRAFVMQGYEKPRFDFIWHLHPEFELTYIQRGYGVRYVGKSIKPFHHRDLCLLGGNLPHAYGSHPRHTESCRWLVVHFLPTAWGEAFWQLADTRPLAALLRESSGGLRFHGKTLPGIEEKLLALHALPPGDTRGMLLFLEILRCLGEARRESLNAGLSSRTIGEAIDPRIAQTLEWLEAQASRDIHQEDAARIIGMSGPAFSRFFHQKTGRLFSRHLNELRIARACAALITTEKSIAEIAFGSGFNNLANFNRRFSELTGMTPTGYRALKTKSATATATRTSAGRKPGKRSPR